MRFPSNLKENTVMEKILFQMMSCNNFWICFRIEFKVFINPIRFCVAEKINSKKKLKINTTHHFKKSFFITAFSFKFEQETLKNQ